MNVFAYIAAAAAALYIWVKTHPNTAGTGVCPCAFPSFFGGTVSTACKASPQCWMVTPAQTNQQKSTVTGQPGTKNPVTFTKSKPTIRKVLVRKPCGATVVRNASTSLIPSHILPRTTTKKPLLKPKTVTIAKPKRPTRKPIGIGGANKLSGCKLGGCLCCCCWCCSYCQSSCCNYQSCNNVSANCIGTICCNGLSVSQVACCEVANGLIYDCYCAPLPYFASACAICSSTVPQCYVLGKTGSVCCGGSFVLTCAPPPVVYIPPPPPDIVVSQPIVTPTPPPVIDTSTILSNTTPITEVPICTGSLGTSAPTDGTTAPPEVSVPPEEAPVCTGPVCDICSASECIGAACRGCVGPECLGGGNRGGYYEGGGIECEGDYYY
jgi:hypothetical protein